MSAADAPAVADQARPLGSAEGSASPLGEFALIERYFTRPPRRAVLGIGDDCALVAPSPGMQLAISCDMLVEGRHFLSTVAPQRLGHKATIFVPDVSAPVKIARIRSYGADTRVGGARYADALDACEKHITQSGALSVHAYDAAETIAGQGSVGLEWEEDAPDLDTVLVAVGGGGLIAGIAAWYGKRVKVVGVEPEGSRALHASLEAERGCIKDHPQQPS